jgi:hypothetical protein
MKNLVRLALFAVALAVVPCLCADDEAKGKKIDFEVYDLHYEKSNEDLKGDVSFVAIPDQETFDKYFGPVPKAEGKTKAMPKEAFKTKVVASMIKREPKAWDYKVQKTTVDGDTLYVQYETKLIKDRLKINLSSPLIVAVDRGKYKSIVFIENGKKVGTADFPK